MPEPLPHDPESTPGSASSEPQPYLNSVDKRNTLLNRKMTFHGQKMQDESLSAQDRDWHAREFKYWQSGALHHDTLHHDELIDQAHHYDQATDGQPNPATEAESQAQSVQNQSEADADQRAA